MRFAQAMRAASDELQSLQTEARGKLDVILFFATRRRAR